MPTLSQQWDPNLQPHVYQTDDLVYRAIYQATGVFCQNLSNLHKVQGCIESTIID